MILSDNGGYTMQPQNKDASAVVPPHDSAQPKRFSRLSQKFFWILLFCPSVKATEHRKSKINILDHGS